MKTALFWSFCRKLWSADGHRLARPIAIWIGVFGLAFAPASLHAEMIGYWNFDSNVNDASGNSNNGAIHGTVIYTNGVFGGTNGATYFSGDVADYVSVPNSASLGAVCPGYVLSFWCKKNGGGGNPISKIQSDPAKGCTQSADLWYWYFTGGAGYDSLSAGSTVYNPGWHHLLLRWDGATLDCFLDGSQTDGKAATNFANSASELNFGKDNRGAQNACQCSVDDAAIFNTNLTVAECRAIYNVGVSTLGYSMADMNKLFTLYANAGGMTNTSDGKTWKYVASGLPGSPGFLAGSSGSYSIVLSDSVQAGVLQTIPPVGLVGYWNFDDNVNDQGGQGNNGAINGTVTYQAGKFGKAAYFDGSTNDFVRVTNSTSLGATWSAFVVSFWGKTSVAAVPIGKYADAGTSGFMQYGFAADGWYYGYGSYYGFISAGANGDDAWHNLVLRWSGTNLLSYMDGVYQESVALTTYVNSTVDLYFGRDFRNAFPHPYTGCVDDAAIFDVPLTEAECKAIHNVGVSTLAYTLGDMNKLFTLYANAGRTTNTSDGKIWEYVAGGLPGNAGELAGSSGHYSVIFSDTGSAGVRQFPVGTIVIVR